MASRFAEKRISDDENESDDDEAYRSLRASISRERSALVQKLMSNPETSTGARPQAYSTASSRTERLLRSAKALKAGQDTKSETPGHQRKKSWGASFTASSTSAHASSSEGGQPPLPGHQRKKSLTEALSALKGGKKETPFATQSSSASSNSLQPRMSNISVLASPQGTHRKQVVKAPEGVPSSIPEEASVASPPLGQRKAFSAGAALGGKTESSGSLVASSGAGKSGPLPSFFKVGSPTKSARKTPATSAASVDSGHLSRVSSAATVSSKTGVDSKGDSTSTPSATSGAPSSTQRIETRTSSLIRRLSAGRPSFLSSSSSTKMTVSAGGANTASTTGKPGVSKAGDLPAAANGANALPRVTPQRRMLMRMHSSNAQDVDPATQRPGPLTDREIKRKQDTEEAKELSSLMERFAGALATT